MSKLRFTYKAIDARGRSLNGQVMAVNRATAIAQLGTEGAFVTDLDVIDEAGKHSTRQAPRPQAEPLAIRRPAKPRDRGDRRPGRVKPRQRVALLRQLSVGLSAGLPLVSALEVVGDQAESAAMRAFIDDLVTRVTAGQALSDAMRAYPTVFSQMQVSMVQAGETAGALDSVMVSLAAFDERDQELRDKLRSASMYPLLVLGFGVISILVILLFILPRILTVVQDGSGDPTGLPWPTRVLMGLAGFVGSSTGVLFAIVLAASTVAWWRWKATPPGRLAMDRFKLGLPLIGPALRRVAVSRFARMLGTLTAASIPVVESLRIVRDTLGNEALARDLDDAADGIERGSAIADELAATGRFPQLLIQVVAMGERTGRLDELLISTASSYDKETATALERVVTIVPVLLILLLAIFVGFILAAALLPIMGMDLGGP